jgi:imidazolonepropionase
VSLRTTANGILFKNFRLITLRDATDDGLSLLLHGALYVRGSRIAWLGSMDEIPSDIMPLETIHGDGRFLSPALIDCHTHVIWEGSRVADWEARLGGASYESISHAGGGILSTVQATRGASADRLYASARARLEAFLRHGVTGVEIKSGYGLNRETELKMLQVATDLRDSLPFHVSRTLLAAHAVPPEFKGNANGYVEWIVTEMIPAARPMCEAVDVFCEQIAFDRKQSEIILGAAQRAGLGIKAHVEQRSCLGGAQLVASLQGWSADHLEYLDEEGVEALAASGTVAVLLPGAFYFLRETQKPPIERLRKHGVPMSVATDLNPGSSPLANLPLAMNMACTLYDLSPAECWRGVTTNAARALSWHQELGQLRAGMVADLAIWDIEEPAELPYGIGHNPCAAVYHRGELVFAERSL